jgi:hypothetical protein
VAPHAILSDIHNTGAVRVKDFLTRSGGWVNPYDIFAQQPESKFFRNNAIISSKGISANGVGWSSGYAAWGGYMKIKPAKWYYAQAGLFLAIPNANNTANHGLDFQGARPANQNGLYFLAETGVTPQIGPSQLPGKYVFGGYDWGSRIPRFLASPLTASLVFTGKRIRCSGARPSPEVADGKDGDAKTHSGGALEAQAQRPRAALVLVLQFRACLQQRDAVLLPHGLNLQGAYSRS